MTAPLPVAGNIRIGSNACTPNMMYDVNGQWQYGIMPRLFVGTLTTLPDGTTTDGFNVTLFRKRGASWTRSGTTITIQLTASSVPNGSSVLLRESSAALTALPDDIRYTTAGSATNSFTVTGVNAGPTSGQVQVYQTYDLSADTAAAIGLNLPVAAYDDHWTLGIGIDAQGRIHLIGNSHAQITFSGAAGTNRTGQNYIYSNGNWYNPTWTNPTWASLPWGSSGYNTGVDQSTYCVFHRLTDGTLLLFMDQPDQLNYARGRDWLAYYLPPAASDPSAATVNGWLPLLGTVSATNTGQFATTNEIWNGLSANRVYVGGVVVQPNGGGPGIDRLHVAVDWRLADEMGNSTKDPTYVYVDLAPGLIGTSTFRTTSWKNAAGTTVTMPLTWENHAAALVGSAPAWGGTVSLAVDKNGYPHMIVQNGTTASIDPDSGVMMGGGTVNPIIEANGASVNLADADQLKFMRCYWDGAQWRRAAFDATAMSSYGPTLCLIKSYLWVLAASNSGTIANRMAMTSHGAHISDPFIRMKIAGAVLPVYKLSNGNLSNETWNPNIDMVTLHHKGRIEINIPDGNEPFVYVVGEKASYKKTAKWGDGTLWGSGTLWNA